MTLMSEALEHRRLRAPRENGAWLIDPPLGAVGELIERNVSAAAERDYDVQGRSLARLTAQARGEFIEAAWRYTRQYRDVPRPDAAGGARVFVAGHQPQLFHPGVWFKNFALSALARRHGAVAINLAIDSDTIKSASLRIPTGTPLAPWAEGVPFDRQTAEIPYEERAIIDRDCLDSFGRRAAETIMPFVSDPFVRDFWPLVVARARECDKLGECMAQARHQQEGRWGAATLEIPQSQVCALPAFHWFACHLLARLPRLWEEYNCSVADYRRANRVRSAAHPVPDLAIEDDWLEAPFWIWDRDNPRRRRLFVRHAGDEIVLSDRAAIACSLPLSPEGDAGRAAEQLAELAARGIRLRTRALITTLFARLCLGDIFLHGIGGAKYDQVTDLLIERFFGLKPPGYMALTATLRLPIARDEITQDALRRIDRQLRELAYHPERAIDGSQGGEVEALVRQKRDWIDAMPTRATAKLRGQKIREANERLQPWVSGAWQRLLDERETTALALRAQGILASREYAFCLYPKEPLRRLMEIPVNG